MLVSEKQFARSDQSGSRSSLDRRRHKRFAISLLGRFMRPNKQEHPCQLRDVSVGGAAIISPVSVEVGEQIIAYFDQLGGLKGTVVRQFDDGFAIEFIATQRKREKLAGQITWLINKSVGGGVEERRHERAKVGNKFQTLKLSDGTLIECRILDVSLSGAAIDTKARPAVGANAQLGKLRCQVMRHFENGIAVQFLDIQKPEALRRFTA